jgi:hypothetical protein
MHDLRMQAVAVIMPRPHLRRKAGRIGIEDARGEIMRRRVIGRAALLGLLLLLGACGDVKLRVPSYGYDESYIPFGRD